MKVLPKDVLGYVYDLKGAFFHIIVVLENQPGAVKEIAERLASTKLNVLQGFHSATPGNPQGVWSLFVESKDSRLTTEQVMKAVDTSRYVLDCEVRKSKDGFLIDNFYFPIRIAPNHEAVLIPPQAMRGMLESIARTYGSGGEINEYTEMAHQARQQALDQLAEHAKSMGANAVISTMFDSTEISTTMDEIIAFGTAVVLSPVKGPQEFVKLS